MGTLAAVAAATLSLGAAPPAAHESNTTGAVTSVSVVPATGRAEVVIAIAGAVNVRDFTLGSPKPRIVVDFDGAKMGLRQRQYDKVSRGGIRDVRIGQFKPTIVRVVIDLDRDREYSLVRDEKGVRVSIATEDVAFASWGTIPAAPSLPAAPASVAVEELTLPPMTRPAAPPARTPTTLAPPSSRVAPPAQSQQQRITVTFLDSDIREVVAAFAVYSGRTIVLNGSVKGTITAEINDQPWDVALKEVLEAQGLAAVEDRTTGIIKIDSYVNILNKKATEPLVTRLVPLNYANALLLEETIRPLLSRECPIIPQAAGSTTTTPQQTTPTQNCPIRGAVIADLTTNTLVITEVSSRIDEIVGYVQDLDVRIPQVQIKAKIIFVNRTDIEDLGVTYDLGQQTQFFNRLVQRRDPATFTPVDLNGDGVPDAIGGGTNFDPDVNIIDVGGNALSAIANASQQVANPALSLIFSTAIGKFDLTAFLDALQEVRLADIQAEPSITTLDNHEAEIVVGEQTPIRTLTPIGSGGAQQSNIEFKETGIILRVVPHVTNNRQILMTLHSERSSLLPAASDLGFTFSTQRANNQLLVNDGETAVIGGLTVTQVAVSKSGIPILVDLPFIGKLFGQTRQEEEKRDLLILVTPHIVDEGGPVGGVPGTPPPGPAGR